MVCILMREAIYTFPDFIYLFYKLLDMNIVSWNCRGALNPSFNNSVRDLVQAYYPAILIVSKTKVSGARAKVITERLPCDGAIHANYIGHSGGLWVLWDSTQVEVFELSSTEQEVHVIVKDLTLGYSWFLLAIYASPRYAERKLLWENLATVAGLHSMPWVMAGDFNEILDGEDKFGGRSVNLSRAMKFQECLNNCRMIDLGFFGPKFT